MLTASAIENALSVSVRILPKLPLLYKTDAIISSFGASTIATISCLGRGIIRTLVMSTSLH